MRRGLIKKSVMPSRNQQLRPISGKKRRRKSDVDQTGQASNVPSPPATLPSFISSSYLFVALTVALLAILIKAVIHSQSFARRLPIEPDPDVRLSHFLAWLKDKGANISPGVTLALFPDFGGYGVQAKNAPVQKHGELFTIPSSVIITSESVLKRYDLFAEDIEKTANAAFRLPLARQDCIIALHLMIECSLGESSDIWPYLQILPDNVSRLDTFDDETLDMLQDDALADLARHSRPELSTAWNKGYLGKIATTLAEVRAKQQLGRKVNLYKGCLTFESFHHYVTISSSRAMILEDGMKYLTPLADMMNHMPNYDEAGGVLSDSFLQYHTRNADGSITVRADREVTNAGEQIFEAYGDTDNSLFLEAFGFIPDNNPFHCAMIPPEFIPRYRIIETVFKSRGLSEMPEVCVLADGTVASVEGEELLAFASANTVEGQGDRCLDAIESKNREGTYENCFNYTVSGPIVRALTWNLAGQVYCSAQTTVEEDVALLRQLQKDRSNSANQKAIAVKFRLEEKNTLLRARAASGGEDDGRFTCPD